MNNSNQKTIDIGDLKLNIRIEGPDGASWVTLAHSLATDIRMWEPQIAALSKQYRVLCFDARGHGQSDVPPGPYQMSQLVNDVIALWDALGIKKSHFLGLSMGGMTGVGLALSGSDCLDKLIACDCRLDAPEFFKNMWDARLESIAQNGIEGVVDLTLSTWFTPERMDEGGPLIDQVGQMIKDTPKDGYIACAQALKELDYKKSLSQMSAPTRYIVGDKDGPHPAEMQILSDLTPGADLVVLDNAAHLSNLEQAEDFNRAVLSFLAT